MSGIAVFHDNFAQMGGAERVAEALMSALPGAALHTTLAAPREVDSGAAAAPDAHHVDAAAAGAGALLPSLLHALSAGRRGRRPPRYDLVVTSCFGYAKGVHTRPDATHVCYCYTPMRWVWRHADYVAPRARSAAPQRLAMSALLPWLRRWDLRASRRPDCFVTSSRVVAERIERFYGRTATVIPPPIDLDRFRIDGEPGDYYLIVVAPGRLQADRPGDRGVQPAGRRLVVIGDGPDRARLEALAGPTVTLEGRQPDAVVSDAAAGCRALLFPGEEDFGIAPLEANAAGRPVVAWRGGGATETVLDGETGVFFDQPTVESLAAAIERLERSPWAAGRLRAHAAQYDRPVFVRRIRDFLQSVVAQPAMRRRLATHGS